MSTRETQAQRLLSLLMSRKPPIGYRRVPLPEILSLGIASHTRRIFELRKAGWMIVLYDERGDGWRHTAYRLIGKQDPRNPWKLRATAAGEVFWEQTRLGQ